MINIFKATGLFILVGFLFSCKVNDPILVPEDIAYVAFTNSSVNYVRNLIPMDIPMHLTRENRMVRILNL